MSTIVNNTNTYLNLKIEKYLNYLLNKLLKYIAKLMLNLFKYFIFIFKFILYV